jgi:exoribonuclease-2
MYEGKIVEYIDQGRFICTICLEERGSRLHLLTASNREINLSPKRAIVVSETGVNLSKPRDALIEGLCDIENARDKLKHEIDVEEVWELVRDDEETYDHKYLAELVFGDEAGDNHASAILRAIFDNRLYFKMKNGQFMPNSEDRVDQITRQKEEEEIKAERLRQGSLWLSEVCRGKTAEAPPFKEEIIDLLVQLALNGNDAPDFKYGKELLSAAGITDIRQSMSLLVKLGIWREDENLDLLKADIDLSFTEKELAEAENLAGKQPAADGREDLRHLPCFTIDGPDTLDYDDALSIVIEGDNFLVGIHISDVAAAIAPESALDLAAASRASSHYLPRRQIPMIPPELSQDLLSLKKDSDRLSISLLVKFDRAGELIDYRFTPSIIRVRQQLVYGDVNQNLENDPLMLELHRLCLRLRQKRMDQDALNLSLPEPEFTFNGETLATFALEEQDTPSRMIVAELMIIYNSLTARFCYEKEIPVLFRNQGEPGDRFSFDESGYIYYVFTQRRKLSPLHISTVPGKHSGLGVDGYTQATSPIRRYLDLVIQRQLHCFLLGKDLLYNDGDLEELRISVEPVIKKVGFIKRSRIRYWTLKFLSMHRGEVFEALILNEMKSKYRVILNDFLLLCDLKRQSGMIFSPGQKIRVKIKKAEPWDDILTLEFVDEMPSA